MTYLLILVTTLCTVGSQLLLKHGLRGMAAIASADKLAFLLRVATSPWVAAALALQVTGYVVWFFVITREKLGIAFALSGSFFYLVMALLSWVIFGERLTTLQWAGLGTITVGVLLLAKG
jgi:drug/metabolite transporter (DMT)-like permease